MKDQYGATYRGGDHQVAATSAGDDAADFPSDDNENEFVISSSGRRSIGYSHIGTDAVQQTVTLALQTRRVTGDTPVDPEARPEGAAATATAMVFWADGGRDGSGDDQPILLGDPGSNQILIDSDGTAGDPFVPHAYGYGSDDKFVVEGQVVTMAQFEEILAAYNPSATSGALIANLGTLSWVGFDYNRPNDGATWTIDGLSCRPPAGDGD